jgi:type IV secretory pathway TraG/TraD family ATPase VirD4
MSKIRMVINDPSGEFWQSHADPSKDIFWNPALLGTVDWSIFSDLAYEYDPKSYAYALIPKRESKGGNGDFFDDAAREVFAGVLLRLAQAGATNTNQIARAFLDLSEEEMAAMTAGLTASMSVSADAKQMRAGVLASIGVHLDGMAMMAPGQWSCRDWLEGEGDLYLVGNERQFGGVKRMFLNSLIEMIAERRERVSDIRYLFVLDEYPLLGDIDVDRHLAEKRKFGIGFVLGMQSEAQAESMMGKPRAQTMFNVLGTMLVLNQSTETAQKAAEARFGKQLQLVVGESHQLAVSDQRDAITVNTQQQERPLVMAADFGILGTAQGYLKLVGNFPAARIDFSHWGKTGKVDALTKVVNELPEKDPRFLIQKGAMAEAEWAHGILGNYPSQRVRQEPRHEQALEVDADPEVADFDQPKPYEQDRRDRKLDVDLGDDLPL